MGIRKLAHFSVRTTDVEATRRFYTEILGFTSGYRPPFDFPGLWLYQGGDEADFGTVHVIGVDPGNPEGLKAYLGDKPMADGTGSLDHIAFLANGWPEMRARCQTQKLPYVERTVPSLGLHQVFLTDPSGVTIELNFPAAEAGT